jgi:hypothetical protein
MGVRIPIFPPIQTGTGSFVLADRLAYCRFRFREVLPLPARQRWVEQWILPRWPSAVRIEMQSLEAGSARVPMLSITAPIRVNEPPGGRYGM